MRISDWRSDVCSSDLIYWMVNMSFKTNSGILSSFSLLPQHFTLDNYITIFTDRSWYSGYINSLIYVALNTVISLSVALPAAYTFSRYRFLGDKHVFFWLLTNRKIGRASCRERVCQYV